MRHQSRRRQRKPRRFLTTAVAILAVAAIAAGVILYNKTADPARRATAGSPSHRDGFLSWGVCERRPQFVWRGVRLRDSDRSEAGRRHVLQRMVRAIPR